MVIDSVILREQFPAKGARASHPSHRAPVRRWLIALGLSVGAATLAHGQASASQTAEAIFAGGCFWCVEADFDKQPGVVSTTSGYTGGKEADPTYRQVASGQTGHTEAVRIVYDPEKISFGRLLDVFWRNIDPLDATGQFCDRGRQYRTAIFYVDDAQKRLAEESKQALETSKRFEAPIVTEVEEAATFYPAEDYHQDFYTKNPLRYQSYRIGCGRDRRLNKLWGDEAGGKPAG
ncbi:MAG: peptide-methionine (S)-S-oxide reductase MsrA [Rhodospirillales bacterium]|nr:peptide-methionine (S)-S-oxide reductase MsrA [Rhodospirillales bacterium]